VVAVGGTRLQGPLGPGGAWAGEQVWNGDGAGGGGCSTELAAPAWQQSTSDWSSVGCGKDRAVADVSADADPYTGVAVYYSGFECEYEEGHTKYTTHWCTFGGTSLASPLIASAYALAGGANGVEYPARTLYENELEDPTSLHDVTSGSNGECLKPFDTEEGPAGGTSGCTVSEEAAQCSGQAICVAGPGYDGPTGVGTPDGIASFEPVSEEVKRKNEEEKLHAEDKLREEEKLHAEERQREEKKQEEEKSGTAGSGGGDSGSSGASTGSSSTGAVNLSPATGGSGGSSAGTGIPSPGSSSSQPTIELTALALTPTALLALDHLRPRVSSLGFAFVLSATARVRATLAKLVRVHGHDRWASVRGALTFRAAKGRDRRHLTNPEALAPGRYRLTLTPAGATARTLTFQVG
jgi:hypothetical protein